MVESLTANVSKRSEGKNVASEREYGGDNDHLTYKSGIPTLRSSAHRVKFNKKSQRTKMERKPKQHGYRRNC
jgi:hypothetical protein